MNYFHLIVIPCPAGYVLSSIGMSDEYKCQCNNDKDESIVDCVPDEERLILEVCSLLCIHSCTVGS